ncbi:MAG TPA: family 43 glycosylhydrolase [Phenylobacterium sp.]|uniref:family 43 glycosylhydrolase n=1 Tax=Phenylobacterium sp. TaxID=1871053 RepID=UPI002B49DEBB|nr:family 43 glycosylhydrolase [Phenylobacterium sp.]HKR88372.1 family 43 glycosylhydrolase [Phenylobacterium sp.]
MASHDLATPDGASAVFRIRLTPGPPIRLAIAEEAEPEREYSLPTLDQGAFLDLFEALARDLGLRRPQARETPPAGNGPPLTPILTAPVSPKILYGYGDPCVVRVARDDYRLLVTSNDAPDAFPILASPNLVDWRLSGFVFPQGAAPGWALTGREVSDFWAPELHRLDAQWLVCFTARLADRSLAVGLARGGSPDGPFVPDPEPIVTGGVIDPHILIDAAGAPWLVWKRDDNGVWPRVLGALLHRRPALAKALFVGDRDRRTAALTLTLWPWIAGLEPMAQFFALQLLIEAASADLAAFELRLADVMALARTDERALMGQALDALRTRIYAQRLSADARRLQGEPTVILQNDLPWEGHLIEGVWISHDDGRYYLLYAGNDFSTAHYGIGAAVADGPTGPYRKSSEVFLASAGAWWGPGHPSVALAPDGRRHIFLHAFRAGEVGYKAFRALLAAPIRFNRGRVSLEG